MIFNTFIFVFFSQALLNFLLKCILEFLKNQIKYETFLVVLLSKSIYYLVKFYLAPIARINILKIMIFKYILLI